jgi:hypothetical protein
MTNQETAQVLGNYIGCEIFYREKYYELTGFNYDEDYIIFYVKSANGFVWLFKDKPTWKLRLRPLSDMTVEEAKNMTGLLILNMIYDDEDNFWNIWHRYGEEEHEVALSFLSEDGVLDSNWSDKHNYMLELTRIGFDLGLLPKERVELITKN